MYLTVLWLNALLTVVVLLWYIRRPAATFFHPVTYYLFFHSVIFVLRGLAAYYYDFHAIYGFFSFQPTFEEKMTVQLGTMLGLVAFCVPATLIGKTPMPFRQGIVHKAQRAFLIKPFLIASAICMPLILYSTYKAWISKATGSGTAVLDVATGTLINTTNTAYITSANIMLGPIAVIFAWLFRFRSWSFIPMVMFVILRGGTGGRWPFVIGCASLILLYLYERQRYRITPGAVAAGVAILLVFSFIGADRGAGLRSLVMDNQTSSRVVKHRSDDRSPIQASLEGMDFGNMEFYEYIVHVVPKRTGTFGYFLDNLQLLTEPIPRMLWKGKPIGAPIQMFNLFDYGTPFGLTYSLPGEGWMQLGWPGVVIWCAFIGALCGWVYERVVNSQHSNFTVASFCVLTPLLLTFFRDGIIITFVKTAFWFGFPLLLWYVIAKIDRVPGLDRVRAMIERGTIKLRVRPRNARPSATGMV
ncbi:oligosaccharide repeat unit polymerase [Novosphingobium profundi]|uniref:O-antigen polymerase n=1 Tax=Novosphingobium profundi TaxID=1774954 RepID=UPI001BD9466B|nr:O-antigen polymerase [Novosphingobium profundi]MBT0668338.1 oligosaccharide repeat unit polymerase [Novosphingobium profundi]